MAQLTLAGFERLVAPPPRANRRRGVPRSPARGPDDEFTRAYLRRLAARGAAPKGIAAYRYQLCAVLRAASRLAGVRVALPELFRDEALLGRAIVDDVAADGRAKLSRWTLAQRRSAVRSVASMMRPELLPLLGEEPGRVVDRALRGAAERVGAGYRLTGGTPRRRGGFAPSRDQVAALLVAVGRAPGYEGPRNRAFLGILAGTGSRVNALRLLDGADCLVLPNGRLRVYLHEKGKSERREVELSAEAARDLQAYAQAFNRHAAARGCTGRVRLGEPGAVWRNADGRRWGYGAVVELLRAGCVAAGIPPCGPHALRRAFATEAASRLPRHVVAQAGGWQGIERLDEHYVQPRDATIWEKLSGPRDQAHGTDDRARPTDAPVVVLR